MSPYLVLVSYGVGKIYSDDEYNHSIVLEPSITYLALRCEQSHGHAFVSAMSTYTFISSSEWIYIIG